MKAIDNDLSEALALYIGWGVKRAPHADESKVIDRFGASRGQLLIEEIRAIFCDMDAMLIDWSKHTLASAGSAARDHMHERHPDLSEEALKAIEWKFTFDWR